MFFTEINKRAYLSGLFCAIFTLAVAQSAVGASNTTDADEDRPRITNTPQEQAIIDEFLGEQEEKHIIRTAFIAFSGGGGIIDGGDYNEFAAFNNSNMYRSDGGSHLLGEIGNSQEFSLRFGVMTGERSAVSLGFSYWLKNGSSQTGDFVMGVAPLGTQTNFELKSELEVYGISLGSEYFLANPPDKLGIVKGLSIALTGDVGLYGARWSLWEGTGNINLSTGLFEQITEPLSGQSLGLTGGLRLGYPTGFLGSIASVELGYTYLKIKDVSWTNDAGEAIYATYSTNTSDRVELDFSGLRGKFEFRKYMSW